MDCSVPGFPDLHCLLEFVQTHVHWVSAAVQPSHPLLPPATPAFNLSQHQGIFSLSWLFTPAGQNIGASASASVLPVNIQGWFPSRLTGLISLLSKRLSRIFSSTTIRKHHFFSTQLSLWSESHIHTWLLEKPELWLYGSLCAKWYLCFLICCLGWSSEKAMAPHSSTLAWKIPWTEEPGGLQSMGSLRVGHDWVTSLSLFTFMHWRRKWQPTPVFLPGESQGRGSLVGCRLWGHTQSDTTGVT